ncbi:hypothetical protein AGABI2DRAFT_181677 [Agaricus bisporus var. bisporus H97]|uniref:hypothetical protein n=1 Tax=Agaricus bisporus var. bisporus (strain H97 / ATCC MYA-4626 / FGSC 10389) TaxID=936046 RepID=UPI00029F6E79|nr:hypothetical protein AGABI2DRAFT_181677 [Agaricus bisporus var. bisporus H97]EKV41874.1 hypothetical protein AGABI2DRAFT_181677 [Agaricus bisporus var. bisporus H97]
MAFQLYCNFLHFDKTARHTFTDKPTELAHINERLHHLNDHISYLIELRSALLHRSNQLTSPTYIVPLEVLSYIFNQTNEMEWCPPNGRKLIIPPQKAMILSAVSRQWRQVALSTSKLWEKVECQGYRKLYRDSSLLIQHCALYASSLDISLLDHGYELESQDKSFDTITTILSSSDVTRRLETLKLKRIPSPKWIHLLPSFLRLESLTISSGEHPSVNLSSLPLSRVYLSDTTFDSLILPPSVLILYLQGSSTRHFYTLLGSCPKLVEFTCLSYIYMEAPKPPALLNPLALNNLKKLVWSPAGWFMGAASATELNLPAIAHLDLSGSLSPAPFIMLCHQISASLESLTLKAFPMASTWSIGDLRRLFKCLAPRLRKLSITQWSHISLLDALSVLTSGEGEEQYKNRCLPKLEYLSIGSHGERYGGEFNFGTRVLDLLKMRRLGEDSPFHLDFSFGNNSNDGRIILELELLQELKEFVANRQVEITIKGRKLLSNYQRRLSPWIYDQIKAVLTSPTYIVPHEVLSHIFNQANQMEWRSPQQAIVLSAVSRQWRQVALGTSKLWERVICQGPLRLYRDSSLLIQHCASYASSLDIRLLEQGYKLGAADKTFDTTTTVLSSSDVKGKLKALELQRIPSPQWIHMLPSFLRLESLSIIGGHHPSADLSSLPLSHVYLIGSMFDSLILPPSVLVLHLEDYFLDDSVILLRNCPRLIEFCSETYILSRAQLPPILLNPLALNSLEKLVWSPATVFMEATSATGLSIPVIKNLELRDSEDLRHLFTFPIPTLRKLSLTDWLHRLILNAIYRCLPKLEYLSISSEGKTFGLEFDFDYRVLNLVKRRRIGEDSPFHLDFSFCSDDDEDYEAQAAWQPELLHELKEFVTNRPVKITIKGGEVELDQLPTARFDDGDCSS